MKKILIVCLLFVFVLVGCGLRPDVASVDSIRQMTCEELHVNYNSCLMNSNTLLWDYCATLYLTLYYDQCAVLCELGSYKTLGGVCLK